MESRSGDFKMMLVLIGVAVWLGACALVCGFVTVATGGTPPSPEAPAQRPTRVRAAPTGEVGRIPVATGAPERDAA